MLTEGVADAFVGDPGRNLAIALIVRRKTTAGY